MVFKANVVLVAFASTMLNGAAAVPGSAIHPEKAYSVRLSGDAQVNLVHPDGGTGDMDGSGLVELRIDTEKRQVCYDFTLSSVATPLMAHIHRGPALHNGPSVVTLFTGPGGELANCLIWSHGRLAEIVSNASNFYVSLSTTEYPDGALRGQLPA